MRALCWLPLLGLAGCFGGDVAPVAPIPAVCEDQVYADPTVKDLILRGAGSEPFAQEHIEQLKYAKLDAAHRCMQQKGLVRPGGGVERRRPAG